MEALTELSADTLAHLADHLAGPMASGVTLVPWELGADGVLSLATLGPSALLMAALNEPTDGSNCMLTVTPGDDVEPLAVCRFPAWSAPLSFLPVGVVSGTFEARIALVRDGTPSEVADLPALLSFRAVEGNLGRLLALLKREAPRLRREASAIAAARRLGGATGATLDRIGLDLAVPRFVTGTSREADADYRGRLALIRPFAAATRDQVSARIGPDFEVVENLTPLTSAIRLVAVGHGTEAATLRETWRTRLDAARLSDATQPPSDEDFLPTGWRAARTSRAERLGAFLAFEPGAPQRFAEPVLVALAAVARIAAETDPTIRLPIRAPAASSDNGLGLAVATGTFSELERQSLAAHPLARFDPADPAATGLFRQAGFATVRRLDATTTLLATQAGGLEIDLPELLDLDIAGELRAEVRRPGDFDSVPIDPSEAIGGRSRMRALFRTAPLDGPEPRVIQERLGARIIPRGPSAFLVIAHVLLRDGGTDPFEARIAAAAPSVELSLTEWERLIETLRRLRPVGIAFDTWYLRSTSLRIDGAAVDPTDPRLRRGVRPWRRFSTAALLAPPAATR